MIPQQKNNLYDFDGTIYDGNSSIDFFIFCLMHNPQLIKYVPQNIADLIKIKLNLLNLESSQTEYCKFITEIKNIDILILKFWKIYLKKIKKWYLIQKQDTDLIITSSPDFLINPICKQLNVQLISTTTDNGRIIELCYQKEKLRMLNEKYPKETFDSFYTDSPKDDQILFQKAKNSYLVKGNKRIKIKNT